MCVDVVADLACDYAGLRRISLLSVLRDEGDLVRGCERVNATVRRTIVAREGDEEPIIANEGIRRDPVLVARFGLSRRARRSSVP